MWGNNRVVAPTPGAAIIAIDLGDNFTIKGHHLLMIKDRQFDGRARADLHKHIAELVEIAECSDMGQPMRTQSNSNSSHHPLLVMPKRCEMDATVVEVLTHRRSVSISLWEVQKTKKPTMPTEVTEEEDIEETTTVGVPGIGKTVSQEMKTKTPEKKFDFEKTMQEFMVAQKSSNDFVKNQFFNLKTKVEQGQKNHQASIQDLETKFGRLSD
ncbi:hypothetical protein Tco_0658255 [Tanacetum coccineum]